jgi:hypothetical protein
MTGDALQDLQSATRVALASSAFSRSELVAWHRASGEIDQALTCCSPGASRASLMMAQRHLRCAVGEMYSSEREGLAADQDDAFALARAAATTALFDLASRIASLPHHSSAE